jgi:anti-anti-sigma regulatory factor
MNALAANLSVWAGDKVAVIRISGRANFTSSVDFKALVHGLRAKGYNRFVLDLGGCLLMDSTFLGVLAGMGLKFSEARNGEPPAQIELLHPNDRISDLLENLGVVHLFTVRRGPADPELTPDQMVDCVASDVDENKVTRTCLEAHQTLMDINPANIPKFKDVALFLAEDLKRKEK